MGKIVKNEKINTLNVNELKNEVVKNEMQIAQSNYIAHIKQPIGFKTLTVNAINELEAIKTILKVDTCTKSDIIKISLYDSDSAHANSNFPHKNKFHNIAK